MLCSAGREVPMALAECPECGGKVAESVSTCPHCGNNYWTVTVREEECVCYACNGTGTTYTLGVGPTGQSVPHVCGGCNGKKRAIATLCRDARTGREWHALARPIP